MSTKGAGSAFTISLLRRLSACASDSTNFECAIGRSMVGLIKVEAKFYQLLKMISADQAHAFHPVRKILNLIKKRVFVYGFI